MPGGTQNRNAKYALEVHNLVNGLQKKCGCPIHMKNGEKTEISATLFNRQQSSKDGLQGMCSVGKTFVDSFKHSVNSWKMIFIYDKMLNTNHFEEMKNNCKNEKTKLFYSNCKIIFENQFNKIVESDNDIKYLKFMSAIDDMVKGGLTKDIGIYSSNIDDVEKDTILEDSDPQNTIKPYIKNILS